MALYSFAPTVIFCLVAVVLQEIFRNLWQAATPIASAAHTSGTCLSNMGVEDEFGGGLLKLDWEVES
jgi:uncharacterized membrane protein YdfJ with MMPL/SSD domain